MTELSTHVFDLDLTSVCVTTGVVQLPLKMQPFFVDGAVDAKIDGEPIELEFQGPRRLLGFKSHFEKRGLKANDRVRFELTTQDEAVVAVDASCVKRERSKPGVASESVRSARGAISEHPADLRHSAGADSESTSQSGGWQSEATVRPVRRVTIVGHDMAAQQGYFTDPSMDTQDDDIPESVVTSRDERRSGGASSARWLPLDGLTRDADESKAEELEFKDSTVRAIRRRGAGRFEPIPAEEAPTLNDPGSREAHDRTEIVAPSIPDSAPSGTQSSHPVRLADLIAPEESTLEAKRRRPAPARPRIFSGRNVRGERDAPGLASYAPSAPALQGNERRPRAESLIEERELVPVARAAPRAAQANSAPRDLRLSDGAHDSKPTGYSTNRPVEPHQVSWETESAPAASGGDTRSWPSIIDDAAFGGFDEGNWSESGGPLREFDQPTREKSVSEPVGAQPDTSGSSADLAHVNTPNFETESCREVPVATTPSTGPSSSLEADLASLSAHLASPNTPAIVRSDVLAEQLGLEPERCERALERLSENRDRVSRIRKGAYMIRRDATKS